MLKCLEFLSCSSGFVLWCFRCTASTWDPEARPPVLGRSKLWPRLSERNFKGREGCSWKLSAELLLDCYSIGLNQQKCCAKIRNHQIKFQQQQVNCKALCTPYIFHTGSACFYLVVRLVRCPLQRWSQQLTKCKEGQENTGPVSRGSCSSLHCQSEHVVKVLWQLGRMAAFYAVNGYTVTYHTTTVVTFEVG